MNWSLVGQLLATSAPTIGGLLGSVIPIPGGALLGQALGGAIAKQFGVPATPAAVSEAIAKSADGVTVAKVNAAIEELKSRDATTRATIEAEEARMARQLEATNQTMRVEVLPENRHWFHTGWRPACGWEFWFFMAVYGMLIVWALALAIQGNERPLKVITDAWPLIAAHVGALSLMVGVNIWSRSKDKETTREAVVVAKTLTKR